MSTLRVSDRRLVLDSKGSSEPPFWDYAANSSLSAGGQLVQQVCGSGKVVYPEHH
jgi:hypothetical protein